MGRDFKPHEVLFLKMMYAKDARNLKGGNTIDLMTANKSSIPMTPRAFEEYYKSNLTKLDSLLAKQRQVLNHVFLEGERSRLRNKKGAAEDEPDGSAEDAVRTTTSLIPRVSDAPPTSTRSSPTGRHNGNLHHQSKSSRSTTALERRRRSQSASITSRSNLNTNTLTDNTLFRSTATAKGADSSRGRVTNSTFTTPRSQASSKVIQNKKECAALRHERTKILKELKKLDRREAKIRQQKQDAVKAQQRKKESEREAKRVGYKCSASKNEDDAFAIWEESYQKLAAGDQTAKSSESVDSKGAKDLESARLKREVYHSCNDTLKGPTSLTSRSRIRNADKDQGAFCINCDGEVCNIHRFNHRHRNYMKQAFKSTYMDEFKSMVKSSGKCGTKNPWRRVAVMDPDLGKYKRKGCADLLVEDVIRNRAVGF